MYRNLHLAFALYDDALTAIYARLLHLHVWATLRCLQYRSGEYIVLYVCNFGLIMTRKALYFFIGFAAIWQIVFTLRPAEAKDGSGPEPPPSGAGGGTDGAPAAPPAPVDSAEELRVLRKRLERLEAQAAQPVAPRVRGGMGEGSGMLMNPMSIHAIQLRMGRGRVASELWAGC